MSFFKKFDNLKMKYKTNKKKILSITLTAVGIACLIIGSSMAYLIFEAEGTTQTISAGTLQLNFSNEGEAITLNNAVPQTDEQGLQNTSYTVTLTNTGTIKSNYGLSLSNNCIVGNSYTIDSTSVTADVCIPNDYIKIGVKIGKNDFIIKVGTSTLLAGYLEANESITFELKIWLDESTPNDYQGQTQEGTSRNVIYNGNFKIYTKQVLKTDIGTEKLISQTDNLNESGLYTIVHSADSTLQIGATESVTEYRYRGASPKNYVTFNNETWRIIGIFPTEDENGNIENRIKLIRNESIVNTNWDNGTTAYNYDSNNDNLLVDNKDNYKVDYLEGEENYNIMMMGPFVNPINGENNWARPASLNTYLNGKYYNSLTSEAQSMIGSSKYYLGGYNAKTQTSQDMYSYERKISGSDYYTGTNPNSWVGKLGLMYESDYGYASLNCETKALYNSSDSTQDLRACNDTNWLYNIKVDEWLLPQSANRNNNVFVVSSSGGVGDGPVFMIAVVRPVLYLTSNVLIAGGDGTESNPYQLGV